MERELEANGIRPLDDLEEAADEPPDDLVCPITYGLFQDPVVAADGNTCELPVFLNHTSPSALP